MGEEMRDEMREEQAAEVRLKALLNASGDRAESQGEPHTKDDYQLSARDAARFSLHSVTLTVMPATASANLAIPVTLYSSTTPPQNTEAADLDAALAPVSAAVRKTVAETVSHWQAHFNDPDFNAEAFNLSVDTQSALLSLGFARPLPPLHNHSLEVAFVDDAGQQLIVTVAGDAAGGEQPGAGDEKADSEATDTRDDPDTQKATSDAVTSIVTTVDLTQTDSVTSTSATFNIDATTLQSPERTLLSDLLETPIVGETANDFLRASISENDEADFVEESLPLANNDISIEGSAFGQVELSDLQTTEKIFFSDVEQNAIDARFVRDANGVKFLVTLEGVASTTASLYGYIPDGWDVTVFDRNGAPVSIPDAVYVYETPNNQLVGDKEDNILRGGDAAERLSGGNGNDTLIGGGGDDTYLFSGYEFGADLIVDYQAGEAIHLLDVAAHDVYARFVGDDDDAYLLISIYSRPEVSANIRVDSPPGTNVALFAQDGAAVQIVDSAYQYGTQGDDYITLGTAEGMNEDNTVFAGDGDDLISDLGGNNSLYGEAGNDMIFGGDGIDHIIGGEGDDELSGLGGRDIFIFTGEHFGHDRIWDYEGEDVVVLSDLDIGKVRARFEVQSGVLQFKILVGEEAQWTASIQFYGVSRLQSEPMNFLLDNDVPLITDEAFHHLGGVEQDVHIGRDSADVFHIGAGAIDIVQGFDASQDRLALDVSDALEAQLAALQDGDAKLALLGEELGLTIDASASVNTGTASNDAALVDTTISFGGEVALILEDSEDLLDFTQFDIY